MKWVVHVISSLNYFTIHDSQSIFAKRIRRRQISCTELILALWESVGG